MACEPHLLDSNGLGRHIGEVLRIRSKPAEVDDLSAPAFVSPMKPLLVETAPAGDGWIHEIKHDGFRTLLVIEADDVRAFTSTGLDWTRRYSRVVKAAADLEVGSAVIDGELVVQDGRGVSDFFALRSAIENEHHRLVFFAFDLLHLDGEDLRDSPIEERRGMLRELLGLPDPSSPIQFSQEVVGSGPDVFAAAEKMGLEGVVSKQPGSRYRSGPQKAWRKTKSTTTSELILIGSKLDDRKVPTLLFARETDAGLAYAGSAILAMPATMRDELRNVCELIKIGRPAVPGVRDREAWWFKPKLRVRVRHLRGEGGMLRHATAIAIVD